MIPVERLKCPPVEHRLHSALFMLTAVLATASCAQNPPRGGVADAPGAGRALAQIEALIGDAACHSDSECRVIGIGAVACGGPEAFRAWSTLRTQQGPLEERVARDAAFRRSELERLGMQSTCVVKPVPAVTCVASGKAGELGRCTLRAPRSSVD